MNKKEFSAYLHKPHLIDKHAEIALQEVVADFPYFQAAQQLLLKAHQNNGSYHFDKQLSIASLLHGNRALLYAFLKDSLVHEFEQITQDDPNLIEETLDETGAFLTTSFEIEKLSLGDTLNAFEKEVTEINDVGLVESISDDLIAKELDFNDDGKQNPDLALDTDLPFQDFDRKYSSYLTPEDPAESPDFANGLTKSETTEAKIPVSEMDQVYFDLPFQNFKEKYLDKQESEEGDIAPMSAEESKVIAAIEPVDFLSWLQSKRISHPINEKYNATTEQIVEGNEIAAGNDLQPTAQQRRLIKYNDLIDRFIETSPSISKPQPAKFYKPTEKAKESFNENFDLVTETLAKIYIKQANYKRAILVYEKLSLLYPEKISYFATRISELQTLLIK